MMNKSGKHKTVTPTTQPSLRPHSAMMRSDAFKINAVSEKSATDFDHKRYERVVDTRMALPMVKLDDPTSKAKIERGLAYIKQSKAEESQNKGSSIAVKTGTPLATQVDRPKENFLKELWVNCRKADMQMEVKQMSKSQFTPAKNPYLSKMVVERHPHHPQSKRAEQLTEKALWK
mmetsp:Transcript_6832/g.11531  ORF Transcript_6832/g.11531 Transcript_6832/m.11531 type:complete len:175 (+) Transcript_6832:118-642(+)|eukprot:CAMPEP_0168623092 /NCGR_PEP_ID=MMETSP0449_2-20121227/8637_1 /TAXON_ID=1082188 /ORGANISM="Strombidium rassoulzadegani, Strain ras09" /LENGTH=174 /DNA_ID=CAMNT_0008664443 /DNA_START=72 /DNA_END=596 /DNA_ORIENTATION=+